MGAKWLCVVLLAGTALQIAADLTQDSSINRPPVGGSLLSVKEPPLVHLVKRSDVEVPPDRPGTGGDLFNGFFNLFNWGNPSSGQDETTENRRKSLVDFELNIERNGNNAPKVNPTIDGSRSPTKIPESVGKQLANKDEISSTSNPRESLEEEGNDEASDDGRHEISLPLNSLLDFSAVSKSEESNEILSNTNQKSNNKASSVATENDFHHDNNSLEDADNTSDEDSDGQANKKTSDPRNPLGLSGLELPEDNYASDESEHTGIGSLLSNLHGEESREETSLNNWTSRPASSQKKGRRNKTSVKGGNNPGNAKNLRPMKTDLPEKESRRGTSPSIIPQSKTKDPNAALAGKKELYKAEDLRWSSVEEDSEQHNTGISINGLLDLQEHNSMEDEHSIQGIQKPSSRQDGQTATESNRNGDKTSPGSKRVSTSVNMIAANNEGQSRSSSTPSKKSSSKSAIELTSLANLLDFESYKENERDVQENSSKEGVGHRADQNERQPSSGYSNREQRLRSDNGNRRNGFGGMRGLTGNNNQQGQTLSLNSLLDMEAYGHSEEEGPLKGKESSGLSPTEISQGQVALKSSSGRNVNQVQNRNQGKKLLGRTRAEEGGVGDAANSLEPERSSGALGTTAEGSNSAAQQSSLQGLLEIESHNFSRDKDTKNKASDRAGKGRDGQPSYSGLSRNADQTTNYYFESQQRPGESSDASVDHNLLSALAIPGNQNNNNNKNRGSRNGKSKSSESDSSWNRDYSESINRNPSSFKKENYEYLVKAANLGRDEASQGLAERSNRPNNDQTTQIPSLRGLLEFNNHENQNGSPQNLRNNPGASQNRPGTPGSDSANALKTSLLNRLLKLDVHNEGVEYDNGRHVSTLSFANGVNSQQSPSPGLDEYNQKTSTLEGLYRIGGVGRYTGNQNSYPGNSAYGEEDEMGWNGKLSFRKGSVSGDKYNGREWSAYPGNGMVPPGMQTHNGYLSSKWDGNQFTSHQRGPGQEESSNGKGENGELSYHNLQTSLSSSLRGLTDFERYESESNSASQGRPKTSNIDNGRIENLIQSETMRKWQSSSGNPAQHSQNYDSSKESFGSSTQSENSLSIASLLRVPDFSNRYGTQVYGGQSQNNRYSYEAVATPRQSDSSGGKTWSTSGKWSWSVNRGENGALDTISGKSGNNHLNLENNFMGKQNSDFTKNSASKQGQHSFEFSFSSNHSPRSGGRLWHSSQGEAGGLNREESFNRGTKTSTWKNQNGESMNQLIFGSSQNGGSRNGSPQNNQENKSTHSVTWEASITRSPSGKASWSSTNKRTEDLNSNQFERSSSRLGQDYNSWLSSGNWEHTGLENLLTVDAEALQNSGWRSGYHHKTNRFEQSGLNSDGPASSASERMQWSGSRYSGQFPSPGSDGMYSAGSDRSSSLRWNSSPQIWKSDGDHRYHHTSSFVSSTKRWGTQSGDNQENGLPYQRQSTSTSPYSDASQPSQFSLSYERRYGSINGGGSRVETGEELPGFNSQTNSIKESSWNQLDRNIAHDGLYDDNLDTSEITELNSREGDLKSRTGSNKHYRWNLNWSRQTDENGKSHIVKWDGTSLGDGEIQSWEPEKSSQMTNPTSNSEPENKDGSGHDWTITARANLTGLGNSILDTVADGFQNIHKIRTNVAEFAANALKKGIQYAADGVKAVANTGRQGLQWGQNLFDWGKQAVKHGQNMFQSVIDTAAKIARKGVDFGSHALKNLGEAASSGLKSISNMADKGAQGLVGMVDRAVEAVRGSEVPFAKEIETGRELSKNLVAEATLKINHEGQTDFNFNIGGGKGEEN